MLSFLTDMITRAGEICLAEQENLRPGDLEFKSRKDLVTATDKHVETYIVQQIQSRFPTHGILGEETGRSRTSGEFLWIIDPIDGTTSFFHGQPYYAVSIALEKAGDIILAAVFAPALGQLFYAQKNQGAFLNDKAIQVSVTTNFTDAVMATGFACLRAGHEHNNLVHFNKIVPRLRDIRRCGSAAVDLAYVACGKLDGFWEMNLNIYDVAAGILLVTEAGGIVSDFSGKKHYPDNGIIAANHTLAPMLMEQLN